MNHVSAVLGESYAQAHPFDWALVDVETSGFRAHQHRVLSVAVINVDRYGKQTDEFTTLLNPGCDPGPVDIHGLTADRLRGAPLFEQVAGRLGAMLQGRVMVAHNAQFDYEFLAHEFARAGSWLPVSQRLCTLALNRQLAPPTSDLRLGTLAAHYGVRQLQAHDAADDVRVLAGVLRESLKAAAHLDMPLPLLICPPRQAPQFTPKPPKIPCAYRNPGRLAPGGALKQGMKIAITGETAVSRAELAARSVAAGLNVMASVSRLTSVLVANDDGQLTAKAKRAAAEGIPVVDERTFLRLLDDVRQGIPHQVVRAEVVSEVPAASPEPTTPRTDIVLPAEPLKDDDEAHASDQAPTGDKDEKPLAGHRVLVLGGTHPQAVRTRSRVVELGGSAAVNLSGNVTDLVILQGGYIEPRRLLRIQSLDLPTHNAESLDTGVLSLGRTSECSQGALVLPRGGVVDLPNAVSYPSWTVTATWSQQTACEIDIVAFSLDEDEQVICDEDFVFYGSPQSPNGAVRLSTDAPTGQAITLDVASTPPTTSRVVIAAAIDGDPTFGDVGAIEITAAPGATALSLAEATLDAATTERTLLLAELYRRGATWRFRAVGQGYDFGLDTLARSYGVDIAS
ncbi:TerD family protein [Streptomyces albidus (ex Kaewkla and Franco 2022)]|uniref:TerD family protein n=1 Tax=Streptomyces albidus (ex Kaewkla and Franco 2022) TaxID=722709 RepID=UPI0015EF6873|nr:TerD family protein [Streptomyces albidus (ex Kaewkla and Franco 2022)]